MSRREYPHIGSDRAVKRGLCSCCNQTAKRCIGIQVDWFRGNDEVLNLCVEHYAAMRMAQLSLDALFELAAAEKDRRRKHNEIARERAAQRKLAQANTTGPQSQGDQQ